MCYWLICVLLIYGVEISKQFFDFFCLTKSKCKTALTTLTTQRYLKIYSVYALNTYSLYVLHDKYLWVLLTHFFWHWRLLNSVFFIWTIVPDLTVDADKDVVVFVPHQQLPMSETKSLLCIIILYNFNINYITVLFGISRNRKVGFKSNKVNLEIREEFVVIFPDW